MKGPGSEIFRCEFCCFMSEQDVSKSSTRFWGKLNCWASLIPPNLYQGMVTTQISEWQGIAHTSLGEHWTDCHRNCLFCPTASSSDIRQTTGRTGAHHWRMERWLLHCVTMYTLLPWKSDYSEHPLSPCTFLLHSTWLSDAALAWNWASAGAPSVSAQYIQYLRSISSTAINEWKRKYFEIA